jgi:hypothetical protein
MIQDLLILDTDADIFLYKTLEDLEFINSALGTMLLNLKENFRLIERDEQLYNLIETERQFCDAVGELGSSQGAIAVRARNEPKAQLGSLVEKSQDRQKVILNLIAESRQLAAEPVVGYEELHELLSR